MQRCLTAGVRGPFGIGGKTASSNMGSAGSDKGEAGTVTVGEDEEPKEIKEEEDFLALMAAKSLACLHSAAMGRAKAKNAVGESVLGFQRFLRSTFSKRVGYETLITSRNQMLHSKGSAIPARA